MLTFCESSLLYRFLFFFHRRIFQLLGLFLVVIKVAFLEFVYDDIVIHWDSNFLLTENVLMV